MGAAKASHTQSNTECTQSFDEEIHTNDRIQDSDARVWNIKSCN